MTAKEGNILTEQCVLLPELFINDSLINLQSIILGLKTCLFCFMFV
jgi:hypothetical protein